jgi:hypothetical protein
MLVSKTDSRLKKKKHILRIFFFFFSPSRMCFFPVRCLYSVILTASSQHSLEHSQGQTENKKKIRKKLQDYLPGGVSGKSSS